MDNSADYLSTTRKEQVKSFREWAKRPFNFPIAEHGFSMLIRVHDGSSSHSVLFDAGISPDGVIKNARRMGVKLAEIEGVVLSHGHFDHFGGLPAVVKAVGRDGLPIIVHEDMFQARGVVDAEGNIRKFPPFPTEERVRPARYVKAKGPLLLADGLILVTGEVPRRTDFERGLAQHRAFVNGQWRPDPWIWDDRAIVINVKRRGLVVVSGCAHAGIINTILYAQQLTGTEDVYAVLGGLHLAGKEDEPKIDRTVEELRKIGPELIAPSHCTGWRGAYAIAEAMPEAFVWGSVGNLYKLQAD